MKRKLDEKQYWLNTALGYAIVFVTFLFFYMSMGQEGIYFVFTALGSYGLIFLIHTKAAELSEE